MRPEFYDKYRLFYDSFLRQLARTNHPWGGVYSRHGGVKAFANTAILLTHSKAELKKGRVSHVFNHKWFWVDILEVGLGKYIDFEYVFS